jgi:putative toxin-antitoxin system antitoxin component (TIGR02293 family)
MEKPNTYQTEPQEPLNLISEPVASYGPSRISLIRKGLQFNAIARFTNKTGLTKQELANVLQVSVRTLQRHESQTRLSPAISEKLMHLNDIYQLASESLGTNPKDITAWLRTQNTAFGSETPLSFLDTYVGMQQVKNILGRLSHGVFS